MLSDPLEISVIDPCMRSIVNFDEGLIIDELLVPPGDDLLTLNYIGPTDSVSDMYGNGYDKCGNLTYNWVNTSWKKFENKYFSSNFTIIEDEADQFTQNLTSTRTGTTLNDVATLVISLPQYPTSTPAMFNVLLTYRECFPFDFAGPKINDVKIRVGDPGP